MTYADIVCIKPDRRHVLLFALLLSEGTPANSAGVLRFDALFLDTATEPRVFCSARVYSDEVASVVRIASDEEVRSLRACAGM